MSANDSNVHNLLRVSNFCTRVIKNEQILGTVIFQSVDKFEVGVDRKNIFCQTWVEMFQLSTSHVSSTFCRNRSVQPEI